MCSGNSDTEGPSPSKDSATILVVDDEAAVRNVSKLYLEQCGYTVLTAEAGHRGLHVFVEHAAEISLVLLDMTMPGLNGEEVFRELRRHRNEVPVILSSGFGEQETMHLVQGSERTYFIKKPYRPRHLLEKVREVLDV